MHKGVIAPALACLLLMSAAQAQDDATAPAGPPREPRPALMVPLAAKGTLLDIAQAGTRLVAVGDHGDILVSDNGSDWRQVASPVDVMLTRLYFHDALHGWAVGHDGAILHTEDGGLNWSVQRWVPDKGPLYDILFLDAQNGLAVGSYASLLRTSDGGHTWTDVKTDIQEPGLHFNAIVPLADGTLFIAGERGMMARSSDNGVTWTMLDSPYKGSMFGALPWGAHGVITFGLRGNIYITDDVRAAREIAVKGWDEFDRETVIDPAALAKLGWRHLENASNESLLRGAALADGALLTGIDGVLVQVTTGQDTVHTVKSSQNETLSGLLQTHDAWVAVGARGIRPLTIKPGEHS